MLPMRIGVGLMVVIMTASCFSQTSQKSGGISEAISELRSSSTQQALAAVTRLSQSSSVKAVDYLVYALDDDRAEIRRATADALVKLGPNSCKVMRELGEPSSPAGRVASLNVVIRIGNASIPNLLEGAREFKDNDLVIAALSIYPKEALGSVMALAKSADDRDRAYAVTCLGILAGLDTDCLAQSEKVLVGTIGNDGNLMVKTNAARALKSVPTATAKSALLNALKDDDYGLRTAAIESLSDLKATEARSELIRIAKNDPVAQCKKVAIEALGKVGLPADAKDIVEFLRAEDMNLRIAAIASVCKMGDKSNIQLLLDILCDATGKYDAATKTQVVRELGDIRDGSAFHLLVKALKDDSLRAEAAMALGKMGNAEAVPPLIELVSLAKDRSRPCIGYDQYVQALWALGDKRAVKPLADIMIARQADGGTLPGIIASTLAKIGGPDAINALIALSESDNLYLRLNVARSLASFKDPKAAACLGKMLEAADKQPEVIRAAIQQALQQQRSRAKG